ADGGSRPVRRGSNAIDTWATGYAMAELDMFIVFVPGRCAWATPSPATPSPAVGSISCDLCDLSLFISFLLGGLSRATESEKKSRRGETLGSVRPRRHTRQRAPRHGRGALHLVFRRRQLRYFAERLHIL